MKKLFAFSMCLVYILMFSVPAVAAGTELKASAEALRVGETITLTVSVNGANAAKSVGIAVNYNRNSLEIVSGEWLLSDAVMSAFDPGTAKAVLAYGQTTDMNGDMFVVTLRAKNPTKTAEAINVEVDMRDGTEAVYSGTADANVIITAMDTEKTVPPATKPPETAAPPSAGIQGTVNVPAKDSLQFPETAPSHDVISETEPAAEQEPVPTHEESPTGFLWVIGAIVVASVVGFLIRRRKKTRRTTPLTTDD